ncbi:MAG: biotin--[acetyl-CoA-carboxylase] ligase [Alphaproteobacteria bacterium]|nr:biotin--[acetyl-CoA-carboxylase] ligase [Alphaproteobacteria bacterium]
MSRPEWHLEDLWLSLQDCWPGLSVEWLPQIDSTNTELARRVRRGQSDRLLLVAEHQTAGRGRLGRDWQTPAGSALTFSLGMALNPPSWSGLSLAVGLTLAEALDPQHHMGLGLKWPNDLWHWPQPEAPSKVGGILIETLSLPDPAMGRYVIIGVGINLHTPDIQTGGIAPRGLEHWGPPPEPGLVLAQVAPALGQLLVGFERLGAAPWLARYASRDLLLGQALRTSQGLQGLGRGVDEHGALLLDTEQGLKRVESSDISVRPLKMTSP